MLAPGPGESVWVGANRPSETSRADGPAVWMSETLRWIPPPLAPVPEGEIWA